MRNALGRNLDGHGKADTSRGGGRLVLAGCKSAGQRSDPEALQQFGRFVVRENEALLSLSLLDDASRGGKIGFARSERFGRRQQALLFEILVTGQIGKGAHGELRRCYAWQAAALEARKHQAFGKGRGPAHNDGLKGSLGGIG